MGDILDRVSDKIVNFFFNTPVGCIISGTVLILLAAGCLMWGLSRASDATEIKKNFIRINAVVADSYEVFEDEYWTDLKYYVGDVGYTFSYKSSTGSSIIGGSYPLLYNPANPGEAYREYDLDNFIWPFIVAAVLGLVGVTCIYTSFWIRKMNRVTV